MTNRAGKSLGNHENENELYSFESLSQMRVASIGEDSTDGRSSRLDVQIRSNVSRRLITECLGLFR